MIKIKHSYSHEEQILKFQEKIEVYRKQVDSYPEAIISFCEDHGIDELEVIHLISPSLEERIRKECVATRWLKPETHQIEF